MSQFYNSFYILLYYWTILHVEGSKTENDTSSTNTHVLNDNINFVLTFQSVYLGSVY